MYNILVPLYLLRMFEKFAPWLERHGTQNEQTLACLSKLQLLCVHPSLVVDATAEGGEKRREMSKNVGLSGKLMALRELLWDAGIGERCVYVGIYRRRRRSWWW